VGGELVEESKEQLFWVFRVLSAVLWAGFLKLNLVVEPKNRNGHVHPSH